MCVGVSEGSAEVVLSFGVGSALELLLPLKEDAARVSALLSSAVTALEASRARQRDLESEELSHFAYNEALDRRLRLVTLGEVSVLFLAFAAELCLLTLYLRAKEFL